MFTIEKIKNAALQERGISLESSMGNNIFSKKITLFCSLI